MKPHFLLTAACAAALVVAPTLAGPPPVSLPVEVVAQVGGAVPGIADATFSNLNAVSANAKGDLVFHATIAGTGITSANNQVIVSRIDGVLRVEARTGDASPLTVGGTITDLASNPTISSTSEIVYRYADTASLGNFALAVVAGNLGTGDDAPVWNNAATVPGTPFIALPEGIGSDPDVVVNGGFVGFVVNLDHTGSADSFQGAFTFDIATGTRTFVAASGDDAPDPLGGTFAPPTVFEDTFNAITVSPDGRFIFTGNTTTGEPDNVASFFAFDPSDDSLTPLVNEGDRAPGTRPGRGFDDFGTVDGFGGTDVIFDCPLFLPATGQPTPSFEAGLFQANAAQPGKPAAKALRDRAAAGPPRGTVYSFFSALGIGPLRTSAFVAELFKRPNGITPPADRAVFACPRGRKPVRLFTGGNVVSGLPEGITIQGPSATKGPPFTFGPGGNLILVPVDLSNGDDALVGAVFPPGGRPFVETVIRNGLTVDAGPSDDTLVGFDTPVTPLNDGRLVFNGDLQGGGESILIGDPPVKPAPNYQPDLICRIPGTGGDNVHERKAKVQRYAAATKFNLVTDFGITLENDGTVDDTIRLSGDRDARFFKWFIAGPPEVEITADVLGATGRNFTLKPGERVSLILRTERQNIEVNPKPKTAKITFKAVSQGDTKKVDQQTVTVTYSAP